MLSSGQRLRMLRATRQESLRELEQAVGLHYSYLGALEREHKSFGKLKAEHLLALAGHFGVSVDYLLGRVPPQTEGFVRARLTRLSARELEAFRSLAHAGRRAARILEWLVEAGYPEYQVEQVARQLGYAVSDLEVVFSGRVEMPEALIEGLAAMTGLPERLFLYGDMGPSEKLVQELAGHPDAEAYFEVLALAVRNGVSPRSLRHLVESLLSERDGT